MKANTIGDFFKENLLRDRFLFNSGDVLETKTPDLTHMDGIGLVIAVETAVRVIAANGTTDHVVSGTKTWTFAAGAFGQGDVGGTFVIANSGAGNNGSYVIATVVDDHTVTSVGAPAGNETFGATVTATLTDLDLAAVPTFEVANDYVKSGFASLGQLVSDGHWADITSGFSPSFSNIAGAGNQYAQAYPLVARRGKLVLTPSAGAAYISIFYSAKGNS